MARLTPCALLLLAVMAPRSISEVLDDHVDRLISIPGVSGAGIGDCSGTPCIKVFVIKKTPSVTGQIPTRLDGYEVVIEETGEFRAPPPPR